MTSGHPPTEMITDYAAGSLSPGMSLAVASHLTFCPCCRGKASRLEALGGALLATAAAAEPTPACLSRTLAALDAPEACGAPPAERRDPPLPRPLCGRLPCQSALTWTEIAPGLSAHWLDGFAGERVGLVRAEPGARAALGGHAGLEATLVLSGQLRDRAGTWCCGDLVLADADADDAQEATGEAPCLCLMVLAAEA